MIAYDTFMVKKEGTHQYKKERIELRRIPTEMETLANGEVVKYTHGIWADGRYIEKLTSDEAKHLVHNRKWEEVFPERL